MSCYLRKCEGKILSSMSAWAGPSTVEDPRGCTYEWHCAWGEKGRCQEGWGHFQCIQLPSSGWEIRNASDQRVVWSREEVGAVGQVGLSVGIPVRRRQVTSVDILEERMHRTTHGASLTMVTPVSLGSVRRQRVSTPPRWVFRSSLEGKVATFRGEAHSCPDKGILLKCHVFCFASN